MPTPVPVTLEAPDGVGGLLSAARPLPTGWQRGVSFTDNNCLTPVVMGECPSGTNLKPGQRGEVAMFRPVSVVMAVECTTFSHYPVEDVSSGELGRTDDFALARELLTGEASARDRNPNALDENQDPFSGNPSLQSEATDLGATFASVTEAVACLEQKLAEQNAGRGGVIFASPALLTHMMSEQIIIGEPGQWRTANGTRVIASGGFDGRAPTDSEAPAPDAALYLYASTAVYAGTGQQVAYNDVDRDVNTETSRSEEIGLVVFSPCAVFAAASTAATAC